MWQALLVVVVTAVNLPAQPYLIVTKTMVHCLTHVVAEMIKTKNKRTIINF